MYTILGLVSGFRRPHDLPHFPHLTGMCLGSSSRVGIESRVAVHPTWNLQLLPKYPIATARLAVDPVP